MEGRQKLLWHLLALACAAALEPGVAPLQGVRNFRAVSPTLPGIYRSANLDQATAADAAWLLDGCKIRTVIDLRNDDEIEKARKSSTLAGRQLLAAFDGEAAVGAGCVASYGTGRLRRVHVPLLSEVDGFFDEVAARLTPLKKAEALMYKTVDMKRYNRLLYAEVARGKQALLYTAMLKSAPPELWEQALSLSADRSRGGVLIHCAQGKDRTGVLAALLQHAAGDSTEEICREYARSEGLLAAAEEEVGCGEQWRAFLLCDGKPPRSMY